MGVITMVAPPEAALKPKTTSRVSAAESVTLTVKLVLIAPLVVPLMTPVEALMLSPAGKEPLAIDQVYGAVPPVALNVVEYAAPEVAAGIPLVVMRSPPAERGTIAQEGFPPVSSVFAQMEYMFVWRKDHRDDPPE